MQIKQEFCDRLVSTVKKAVAPYGLEVTSTHYGSAVKGEGITPESCESSFWIRVTLGSNGVTMEISRIYISPGIQRKGLLTKMMNNLRKLPEVEAIIVPGVCTAEMNQFCIKRGMTYYQAIYGYIENVW